MEPGDASLRSEEYAIIACGLICEYSHISEMVRLRHFKVRQKKV